MNGCGPWQSNTFVAAGGQVASMIILAHLFKLMLKSIGQPSPLAHVLAGFVLGPSALSRIHYVQQNIMSLDSSKIYFEPLAMLCRTLYLFLIGLEIDIPYLRRDFRHAMICSMGGSVVCCVFALTLCPIMFYLKRADEIEVGFWMIFYVIMSITSGSLSFTACMTQELKISTTDMGRLTIHSAAMSYLSCNFLVDIGNLSDNPIMGIISVFLVGGVIFLNKFVAGWLNKRNMDEKYLKNAHFLCIIAVVVVVSDFWESNGYHGVLASFLLGLFFPRSGKTTRTLLQRIGSCVHIFVLPVYFGYAGLRVDITQFKDFNSWIILIMYEFSAVVGKGFGVFAACRYLNIPLSQVLVLPLFLCMKFSTVYPKKLKPNEFDLFFESLESAVIVINIFSMALLVPFIVRRDKTLSYAPLALELQNPENELRVLACVSAPRHVSTMIWLVGASSTQKRRPTIPYLIHLVELPDKNPINSNLTYHQLDVDELSDDENYGGDDVVEVNDALDAFVIQNGIIIRQVKVVAPFSTMYEDICGGAADIRATIIILPFHKHQRIDGMMESDRDGIRATNLRVLRQAICTVAILVDRGLAGAPLMLPDPENVHVATLFFGGADDREALAYSVRICGHSNVHLTVIRFRLSLTLLRGHVSETEVDVAGEDEITSYDEINKGVDDTAISIFYNRFVATGQAGYVEKCVSNGGETMMALKEIGDMYALFIVGKGGHGNLSMTSQMSDWEECPELGAVGDLLASSDLEVNGSVLVIQQCKQHSNDVDNDV